MMLRILTFRTTSCALQQLRHSSSQTSTGIQVLGSTLISDIADKVSPSADPQQERSNANSMPKGALVSAAFEQLKTLNEEGPVDIHDSIGKSIKEARDVEGLLSIVSVKKLTRQHALKLVSVLADWTVEGKVQTSDFEMDPRFLIVCRVLGSNLNEISAKKSPTETSKDLATVLEVASDGEAAKLISNISLFQMVKVLSSLSFKKRRSTPLLRSLAFNIASSAEKLDIKLGADALYAVTSLNYHDEMLVDKICSDMCNCLMANNRRAVVRSIITSLGLLRYKHIELLNLLCEWVEKHHEICNTQDLISLVMTLGVVYHVPANEASLFPLVIKQLEASGVSNPQEWLDLVWALTVLNKQSHDHVASVLSPDFIDKIRTINTDGLSISIKLKLLNINGVAKLRLKDYKGPLIDLNSEEWKVPLLRSKDKQVLVASMQETMMNLLPSISYLNTNVETDMGFMIDAECLMTTKLKPLPIFDTKTKAPIDRSSPDMQKGIKVAIMVSDYHDMTRGRRDLSGVSVLFQELARLKGYRIMNVDHIDFNPNFKLVNRVQYLSDKLKAAIGKS